MEVRLTDAIAATSAHAPSVAKGDAHQAAGSEAPAPSAPTYMSPVVRVDAPSGVAVLLVRNGETGEEVAQYPARKVVEEYSSHEQPGPQAGTGQHPVEAAVAAVEAETGAGSAPAPTPAPAADQGPVSA